MKEIQNILNTFFQKDNIRQIKTDRQVYRCEKKDGEGRIYQIIFVEISDNWLEENYLSDIESIIEEDFYNNSTHLQWNYYYNFISTDDTITNNIEKKYSVEKDTDFCRKYVFSKIGFKNFLNVNNLFTLDNKTSSNNDLYSIWTNFLKNKGFSFIVNEKEFPNYTQHIDNFINGKEFKEVDNIELSLSKDQHTWSRLVSLNILNFRKYPILKSFELGTVNLVQGPNATGKTSLLGAFEIAITGSENSEKVQSNYEISLQTGTGNTLKYPSNNVVYKERDVEWYSSGMTKGNNLNNNFRKFNYYSSDAAYDLNKIGQDKEGSYFQVFADIALGKEVNKLEERIFGFQDRFQENVKQFSKQKRQLSESLIDKHSEVSKIDSTFDHSENYRIRLSDLFIRYRWNFTASDLSENQIEFIEFALKRIEDCLQRLNRSEYFNFSENINVISEEIKELEALKASIDKERANINSLQTKRHSVSRELQNLQQHQKNFNDLYKYFSHPDINSLEGLETNISKLTNDISICKQIEDYGNSFFLTPILEQNLNQPIINLDRQLQEQRIKLEDEIRSKQKQIKELEVGVERLTNLISKLQSLGLELVDTLLDYSTCPLCHSHFDGDQLLKELKSTSKNFEHSEVITQVTNELFQLKDGLNKVDNSIKLLEWAKLIAKITDKNKEPNSTLADILIIIRGNEKRLVDTTSKLLELQSMLSSFSSNDLNEERFVMLKTLIKPIFDSSLNELSDFVIVKNNYDNRVTTLTNELNILTKDLEQGQSSIESKFGVDISDEKSLLIKIIELNEVKYVFDQLKLYIILEGADTITQLPQQFEEVKTAFNIYQNQFLNNKSTSQSINLLKIQIEDISKELKDLDLKLNRAELGATTLQELQNKYSKNQFLSSYLKDNRNEVVNIFKFIHSPKEFDDIRFDTDEILLSSQNELKTIKQISTGQRSALALSLFLSLNQKLSKGPDLIIFDDPVTHVDDLNVLSFLDYLRELTIFQKKQIVFATADDDLAFLFSKKFEFLGEEEFKRYNLERDESEVIL